jgi:hypothetical protein
MAKDVNEWPHHRLNIAISTRKKGKELIQAAEVFTAAVAMVEHMLTAAEEQDCCALCSAEWHLP